ncbi:IS110 family transposase [Chloroflexota bacterium]
MARYHVGIDVGKRRHTVCVYDMVEEIFSQPFSFSVDRQGFERFLTRLKLYGPREEVLVGVEASGPYAETLSVFLLERGYAVVQVNPFQAKQFRRAQGKKAKTDRVDARSLAAFLGMGTHKLLSLGDPLLENLRELTRFRVELLQDRTRQVNRLHEALTTAFPELSNHLAALDTPTALALLVAFPTPQTLVAAGADGLTALLIQKSHGRLREPQAQAILTAARTTVGLLRRQRALSLKLELLAQAIIALNTQVQRVEDTIEELFRQLPYDPSDFPVGNVQSLATLLAEIEDVHLFATLKQFLSHFGWCPQTVQSGSFRLEHPRMSHAGNPYVRRMVWMLAIQAIRSVPAYRDYFLRRTAAGKKKMHTLVAVGRKLLSVIYAILKTGRPYDPQQEVPRHLALARP